MITVVIVDDEALVRAGLRMILEPAADITVVGEAADGSQARGMVAELRPDVVLMDVRMPGMDGLTALRDINANPDPPKIIMLTTFDIDDYVHNALVGGAAGFLLKDTPPRQLANAVRTVSAGNAMLAPTVTRRLIDTYAEQPPAVRRQARLRLSVLTDREREVATAVGHGLSNTEVGTRLHLSQATVKAHVSRILAKLHLHNRVQVALLVRDAGHGGD